jgi:methylsterol monooxygenase
MQNDTLATGIMSFVMHEVVYFGRCIPWILLDFFPYFHKYKIQPVRVPRPWLSPRDPWSLR